MSPAKYLMGLGGADMLDGGADADMMNSGNIKVSDTTGTFGIDTLSQIETLKFGHKVTTIADALATSKRRDFEIFQFSTRSWLL